MTHTEGTQDEALYGAMRSAIGAEPPMAAQPHDDLARGRRRLMHRRVGTVLAVGAVVPAVALVATVVPNATSASDGGPGFADASDDPSLGADCGWFSDGKGQATLKALDPPSGPDSQGSGGSGSVEPSEGDGELVAAGDSCEAVPSDPMDAPELDRLQAALTDAVDPSGEHLSMMIAGSARSAVSPDGGSGSVSQASVSGAWTNGDQEGSVDVTVIDPAVDDGMSGNEGTAPCENPTLVGGPSLTCERRELADGSTVVVGTGERDGVERITVRFDRPDGQVVWATADEASTQWWDDGSGADPLDAPPATTNQLIQLAQDDRSHL